MPSKQMLAAVTRFKEAWESVGQRASLSDRDIVEMHEAALALVWATGTTDLQAALDVLHAYESGAPEEPE